MKTYDEQTLVEITDPDLTAGYVYEGVRVTGQTLEVMAGTVTESRPQGLRHLVDVTEPCRYYHAYTEAEKAALSKTAQPSQLDRVEAQATYTAMMTGTLLEEV